MEEYIVQKVIRSDPVSEITAHNMILRFLKQQETSSSTTSMNNNAEALERLKVMAHCLSRGAEKDTNEKSMMRTPQYRTSLSFAASPKNGDNERTTIDKKKDQKKK